MNGLPPELRRALRFAEVGVVNTAITLAVFAGLVRTGCPGPMASALAFAAGALNGYHWNARWTFADRRAGHRTAALRARYVAVQATGTAASALGLALVHGAAGLAHLEAELVILPVVTALTYGLMRGFVFVARDAGPGPATS